MARISVNGIGIDYELLGPAGAPAAVITPGGRFSKEMGGVRELGEALAAGGKRVLLWDRPNCGASDLCFDATTESELHANTLAALLRMLDLGPALLAAGSAGSRVSLITASRHPDIVSALGLWWISGGPIGLMNLAVVYCHESLMAASRAGMPAVAELPCWADQLRRNPKNKEILLAQDPKTFIATLQRWALAYTYSTTSPVPGMSPEDFAKLPMPVLIFRSGESDIHHTRETSEWVHRLIPGSEMIEPPWPDQEWNMRGLEHRAGRGSLFGCWPQVAPMLLEFMNRPRDQARKAG